jgi:hypothetical protein
LAVALFVAIAPGTRLAAQPGFLGLDGDSAGAREETTSPKASAPMMAAPDAGRLSADQALQTYERRSQQQSSALLGYSDTTIVEAELPDTAQHGLYELKRHYAAPKTLEFTPVRFVGDGFVKGNVIIRLLQSEAEHVGKGDSSQTAITTGNYKFSFKSVEELDGRTVYVYQVKPRQKRPGMFKGRVFLDAYTGAMCRAEGTLVKSPSWFVKKIEFVQDYAEVGGFTLPVHLRSLAKARIVGRTLVDVVHRDYHATTSEAAVIPASATLSGSSH